MARGGVVYGGDAKRYVSKQTEYILLRQKPDHRMQRLTSPPTRVKVSSPSHAVSAERLLLSSEFSQNNINNGVLLSNNNNNSNDSSLRATQCSFGQH